MILYAALEAGSFVDCTKSCYFAWRFLDCSKSFLCLLKNEQRRVQEQRAVKRRQEQERQLKKKQEAAGSRTFYVAQARLMYI